MHTSAHCSVRLSQKSTRLLKTIQSTVLPCITIRFVLINRSTNIVYPFQFEMYNTGMLKLREWRMWDRKMQDHVWQMQGLKMHFLVSTGVKNAGLENAGPKLQGWKMWDWKMHCRTSKVNWSDKLSAVIQQLVRVTHLNLFTFLGHLQRSTIDNQADITRLTQGLPVRCAKKEVKVKGTGFLYSIPRIRPGADPGVQAVGSQVTVSHPPGGRLP